MLVGFIILLRLEEFLKDSKTIFFIEWPEKGLEQNLIIDYTKRIRFRFLDEQTREIILNA